MKYLIKQPSLDGILVKIIICDCNNTKVAYISKFGRFYYVQSLVNGTISKSNNKSILVGPVETIDAALSQFELWMSHNNFAWLPDNLNILR